MLNRLKQAYTFLFKTHRYKTWAVIGLFLVWYIFFALPRPLFDVPTSVVLESHDGRLLGAKIAADGQWRFPYNQEVPEKFAKSIITFEDKRFYSHIGVDPIGLGRAMTQNIRNRSVISGGSTLTMQVIRLSGKGKRRTMWQKVTEMIKATRLELQFSKKKILAYYTSNAPFGGNVVGLDAASWRYYGKSADLLSWGEAATLAVLPNAPSLIHPGKNRDLLLAKRNRLLDRLLKAEHIDSLSCELAKTEPLPDKPLPLPRLAPHLLERANLEHFTNQKKGTITRLHSTLDYHLQQQANAIVKKHHQHLSANGIHNLAVLILDIETGNTLAYVGNYYDPSNKEHGHEVDIITAPRSTGSILKPLLYASMLYEGELLPTMLIPDIPTQMKNYRPLNYNEKFDGAVSAQRSLSRSLNIPTVRMLSDYGLEKFHYKLKQYGMTTITQSANHYGLPLILGGAECKLWEITGIYASMGRTLSHFYDEDGLYNPDDFHNPTYIEKEEKKRKRDKYVKEPPVVSAAAIATTFDAMLKVERPTEDGAWEYYQSRRKVAWKTGTSFGFRDAWAVGVNPKYAVGVWVGNADGEGRPGLVGLQAAAPVLFDIFNRLESPAWFEEPFDEQAEIVICKESGYRAKDICPNLDTITAPASGENASVCPYHQTVHLDKSLEFRVHGDCELPSEMVHKAWFVLPPVEEYYYKSKNPTYQVLPPYRADCLEGLANRDRPMQLIYPRPSTKIYVPKDLSGELSKTIFKVAHRKPETRVYWHIDNEFVGTTEEFHELELNPNIGRHELTLVDENGVMVSEWFEILGK